MPRTAHQYADELLANSLAAGRTVAEAARAAGVSERTAYRRMKEPAVRARITEVRRAALDVVAGRLTHGMVAACDHLTELIGHDNPHVQIRAAKTVLQLALQVRNAVDVEDRLEQLREPSRLPPASPALADINPRPVVLELGEAPVDRSGHPERDGTVDSPIEGEKQPDVPPVATEGGNETKARGESDHGEPTCPAGQPAPDAPSEPTQALSRGPEATAHRSGRLVSRGVVVLGLVVAAGLSFAVTGTARAHTEPRTDHRTQTCQNLPEPATRSSAPPAPEDCGACPARLRVAPSSAGAAWQASIEVMTEQIPRDALVLATHEADGCANFDRLMGSRPGFASTGPHFTPFGFRDAIGTPSALHTSMSRTGQ